MSSDDRTYLHVVPEERAAAQAAGALWDDRSKCLYITSEMRRADFSQWLAESEVDDGPGITSSDAYVAVTNTTCCNCSADIEIICIYCECGTDLGEHLTHFTISNIWFVDDGLSQQLARWPNFTRGGNALDDASCFANYCPHCSSAQQEMLLHDEPDAPFFAMFQGPPRSVRLIPLNGSVRLSGDCHFCV